VRLLLDTHIWIWSVATPQRLGRRAAAAIQKATNELWLSPISLWELAMLVDKRRISLDEATDAWIARALANMPCREAPITNEVVLEIGRLRFSHRDPADHFIAASARVFDLTLVTADPRLLGLKTQGVAMLAS